MKTVEELLKEHVLKIARRMYLEGGYTKEKIMYYTEISSEDFDKEIIKKSN